MSNRRGTKPNFIVFLTDDQGYGDLSCMGSPDFRTPNLDRMAADGARFTDWYSNSPVCSPSRASLLTGRYPGNAGVRSILAGHRTATGLPPTVPTIARALKDQGYRTYMSGKWHLGLADGSRPLSHGFDHWYGFLAGCIDYYSHIFYWGMNTGGPGQNPTHDLWEDDQEIYDNGRYFTEMITEKAIAYIRDAVKADEPFFLYVPFNAPHYPMHAPKRYVDRFPDLPPDRRIMAAMISAVDDGVGEILAEVSRHGIAEKTCSFFMADNGPSRESRNWLDGNLDPYYGGTAGKLRGHKFSLFEGGIRVPGIFHWPGTIPGGQQISEMAAAMDVFPTLLTAAGGDATRYELDGRDLAPVLTQGAATPHDEIFWEKAGQTAVRRGEWKLVLNGQLIEGEPPADEVHLSNLAYDLSESTNLAASNPELAGELQADALAWREKIEARWSDEFSVAAQGTTGRTG